MSIRPLKNAEKVALDFKFSVSPSYIEESIDSDGVRPSAEWEVSFDLEKLSPDLRRRMRLAYDRFMNVEPYPAGFPRPVDDPVEFLEILEPWLDEVEAEEAEATRVEEEAAKAHEREQEAFRMEMERWAAERGSTRLRAAIQGGYRANTTYAVERGEAELPGFWIDTASDCEWGERTDPSEEALLLERAVDAHLQNHGLGLEHRIIWLKESPRALDRKLEEEGLIFEAEEAILVADYLSRYAAFLPLDEDCRNDPDVEEAE